MMHAAPEMSPTLDDAIRAFDRSDQAGGLARQDFDILRQFFAQLDDVRDVPAVVLDPAQAAHMEGVYQAGVRCADESGHVLVVSLPVFLALCPPPVPHRDGLLAPFGRTMDWLVRHPAMALVSLLWFGSFVALFADQDARAAAWLFGSGVALALSWCVSQLPPTSCTYDCNSGRACTCQLKGGSHAR